jgi:NDP-sugar pyrophosphorylase family protein
MLPRTESVPKALLPVAGVPFVDHQLRWLAGHGVDEAVLAIGHLGSMLRDHVGDGARLGLRVRYVDEGDDLRGTAGAVRFAVDEGALRPVFLVTYGDSYLPIDFGDFGRAFERSGARAMMSVYRNEGRWDASNVVLSSGRVALYDKRAHDPRMAHIDYGLLAFRRDTIVERIRPGGRGDLADLLRDLSIEGQLAAYESPVRFFEVGSTAGLEDLERQLLYQS